MSIRRRRRTPTAIAASAAASARLPALDGVRVLVVDDEADARELLATILTKAGPR